MALLGAVIGAIGAALVVLDAVVRWRKTSIVIDGGTASTDFQAEERKANRRALASAVGPFLVLVGAVLTILSL